LFGRPININIPHAIASPLAQIYPPLVENIPEEPPEQRADDDTSTSDAPDRLTGVSSIPFTRRRLMSSLAFPPTRRSAEPIDGGHSSTIQPRKTSGSTIGEKSKDLPLTKSPEQVVEEPPSVSEIREAEENIGPEPVDMSSWGKRLQEIEKRQTRMEALLEQIAARI